MARKITEEDFVDETLVRLTTRPGDELQAIYSRHGVIGIEQPTTLRSPWRRSYLAKKRDGEVTSLLQILGVEKFGTDYDPELHELYWLDRNYKNVSVENVGKYEKVRTGKPGRPKKQDIKALSGTREYWRAYREKNKEKSAAYQKAYRQKRAAAAKRMEQMELEGKLPQTEETEPEASMEAIEARKNEMLAVLNALGKD